MRLVHEYNREKTMRWLHKERLQKIKVLEKLAHLNQLSDRRMLTQEYILEAHSLMPDNPADAERYYRLALNICIDMYERGEASDTDDIANVYFQIAQALKLQGKLKESEEVISLAQKYRGPLYTLLRNASCNALPHPDMEPLRGDYSGICYVDLPIAANDSRVMLKTAYNRHKNKKGIGPWDDVQHLLLSNRIKELNDCSFTHCLNLVLFDSGDGVSYLGCDSFSNCPELHTAILGMSVLNRGNRVFNNCPKLEFVYMDAAVKDQFIRFRRDERQDTGFASWFRNCPKLHSIRFSDETQYQL